MKAVTFRFRDMAVMVAFRRMNEGDPPNSGYRLNWIPCEVTLIRETEGGRRLSIVSLAFAEYLLAQTEFYAATLSAWREAFGNGEVA